MQIIRKTTRNFLGLSMRDQSAPDDQVLKDIFAMSRHVVLAWAPGIVERSPRWIPAAATLRHMPLRTKVVHQ